MFKKFNSYLKRISKRVRVHSGISIKKILLCVVLGLIIMSQAKAIASGLSFLFMNVISFNTKLIETIITQLGLSFITYAFIDSFFAVRQNREISKRIDDLATKLGDNIEKLQYSVGITQGALDTGLSAVKATRNDAIKEIKGKMDDIINKYSKDNNQEFTVKILGISLGDYLCPHGPLYHEFKDLISIPKVKMKVLILKDGSYSAIQRAKIEERYVFENNRKKIKSSDTTCKKYEMDPFDSSLKCVFNRVKSSINIDAVDCYSYLQTKCHNELRTATLYLYNLCNNEDRIKEDIRVRINNDEKYKNLKDEEANKEINKEIDEEYPKEIKKWREKWEHIRSYDYAPLLLMIEFDDTMFVENYHLASRGGESPILQIRKGTKLFGIYDDHFNMLFDDHIGLTDPIDSCTCLNKPCDIGADIAKEIDAFSNNPTNKGPDNKPPENGKNINGEDNA